MASGPGLIVASAAKTTTGDSGTLDAPSENTTVIAIDCTAVSGTTPNCTFSLQWSMDGGTTFHVGDTADAFTALTAAAKVVKSFATKGNAYKLVWTITGTTPSFTFSAREMGF
jgi:hypothetical protein